MQRLPRYSPFTKRSRLLLPDVPYTRIDERPYELVRAFVAGLPLGECGLNLRAVLIDSAPWFVVTDLCKPLGFTHAANAARGCDPEDRGTHIVPTPGGSHTVTVVNESGLYALILKSRKPEAKAFKKWVTSVVLPAIRKDGASVTIFVHSGDQFLRRKLFTMLNSHVPLHVTLEWSFAPPGFLKGHLPPASQGYALKFSDGKIEAKIDVGQLAAEPEIERRIDRELRTVLQALQVLRHQPLDIVGPVRIEALPQGRYVMKAGAQDHIVVFDEVNFLLTNAAGEVVSDSFQAHVDTERAFMARMARHAADALLGKLQASYVASIREPQNELHHLYEIKEALATRFGGEHKAKRLLSIVSQSEWGRLKNLANDRNVRQGRHRGQALGEPRDATPEELTDCRRIAKSLINAYLDVLDKNLPAALAQ